MRARRRRRPLRPNVRIPTSCVRLNQFPYQLVLSGHVVDLTHAPVMGASVTIVAKTGRALGLWSLPIKVAPSPQPSLPGATGCA